MDDPSDDFQETFRIIALALACVMGSCLAWAATYHARDMSPWAGVFLFAGMWCALTYASFSRGPAKHAPTAGPSDGGEPIMIEEAQPQSVPQVH